MAAFKVIRRKIYHTEIDAGIAGHAREAAEKLPGRDWILVEDRVVAIIGLDSAADNFDAELSHDPSCAACVFAMARRASRA